MADRRPPGFNVDLGFYDSDEVLSIPRRLRAAAVGIWTLAGAFAANKLTDGYVSAEALRTLGCTPGIRSALIATTKADGSPSPLWTDAGGGAIQFTRWPKWQRTAAEVKAYREADAERKRRAREAKKGTKDAPPEQDVSDTYASREPHVSNTYESREPYEPSATNDVSALRSDAGQAANSDNTETSARTSGGQGADVRAESGTPKTKTETKTKEHTYVPESATETYGRDSVAATPGAELVREIVPPGHPAATLTVLRIRAGELLKQGHPRPDVAAALRLWCDKPSLGPNALASLLSEVIKSRATPTTNGHDAKVNDFLAFANRPADRLEIER